MTTLRLESVFDQFDSSLRDRLIALRRELHQHPELSLEEERTASTLYESLGETKPVQLERAGNVVMARIKGSDPSAPVVAIRGDMDALPVQEDTGLDFASKVPGVMHACGHDVHSTWAVGAAHLLATNPAKGDVLVILQPAEEVGMGAKAVLESGLIDEAQAIFGGHVDRRFPLGQVVAQEGPLAGSSDTFEVTLKGVGAHGARPHEASDPIMGLSALIAAYQTIVSRRLNPADAGVVSIGTIQAGKAPNVIPDQVRLSGTLRAVTPEVREMLGVEVKRLAESIAAAYSLEAAVDVKKGTPPIVNPPEPVAWARQAVTNVLSDDALVPLGFLNMAGEDFSYYMEKIPGCFMRIGAREPGGETIPAHAPYFYAAEESIFIGAAVLAECARVASNALAG